MVSRPPDRHDDDEHEDDHQPEQTAEQRSEHVADHLSRGRADRAPEPPIAGPPPSVAAARPGGTAGRAPRCIDRPAARSGRSAREQDPPVRCGRRREDGRSEDDVGQPDAEVADEDPTASGRGVPAMIASPSVAPGSG